jgi:hypothetical protein
MDGSRFGEVTAVSRFWTPQHVDVTDAPLRYAEPKPSWIERAARRSAGARIDDRDRAMRRRMSSHAVVEATEIPVLPPIVVAAKASSPVRLRLLKAARVLTVSLSRRHIAH